MARRKNTKFIDPRYFMDEKMERLDESAGDRFGHPDYPSGYGSTYGMGGADYAGPPSQSELTPGTKVRKRKSAADVVAPEGRIIGSPEQRGDELIYKVRWTKHAQGQPARVPASALEPIE